MTLTGRAPCLFCNVSFKNLGAVYGELMTTGGRDCSFANGRIPVSEQRSTVGSRQLAQAHGMESAPGVAIGRKDMSWGSFRSTDISATAFINFFANLVPFSSGRGQLQRGQRGGGVSLELDGLLTTNHACQHVLLET